MEKRFDLQELQRRIADRAPNEAELREQFERSRCEGGLTSNAHFLLRDAVGCYLVGSDPLGDLLTRTAIDWLNVAIAMNEKPRHYFPHGTEASRFQTLSLCNWLAHGVHDSDSLANYVSYEDQYLRKMRDRAEVSLALPTYLDAGVYDRILALTEQARITVPTTPARIQTEGAMCGFIAKAHCGGEHDDPEVSAALYRFLGATVRGWLREGHFNRAAQWMKITYWRRGEAALTPQEALLKCLDLC